MTRVIFGKDVANGSDSTIDLDRLLETRMLIQASSGGGKSYAIRKIVEEAHPHVQIILIDIEGEFATLREKYDFLLIGEEGELKTSTKTAEVLARKLLELKASAIIDLYELPPQERKHYVKLFLDAMVNAPKELWHPCLVIVDEAHVFCLDDKTEVLTENGWQSGISYVKSRKLDRVACYDLNTQSYSFQNPSRVLVKRHKGRMVSLESDGISQLVTSDHRVVLHRIQRGIGRYKVYSPQFVSAENVPHHVYIPIGGVPHGRGLTNLDTRICELLGWVITDGYFKDKPYLAIEQSTTSVKMGENMVEKLGNLLLAYGILGKSRTRKSRTDKNGKVWNHAPSVEYYLGARLSKVLVQWLGSDIHRIPRSILNDGSPEQLRALFDGLLRGDGTSLKGYWKTFYAGKNEKLADDVQELCLKLGISSVKRFVKQNGQWTVLLSRRTRHYIRKVNYSRYSGQVWDLTVPTGAFVIRRNGKVSVTGNCPQVGESEAMSAVNDLMTRGRKRGYAGILATQRLSKLHKDAAAEAGNKLIGRCGLDDDMKRGAYELGFTTRNETLSLRNLEPGEFYAFGPALSKSVTKVKVGEVKTTHPKSGARVGSQVTPPTPRIKAMISKLEDLPHVAERELKDKESMVAEIRSLRFQLRQAQLSKPAPQPEISAEKVREIEARAFAQGERAASQNYQSQVKILTTMVAKMKSSLQDVAKKAAEAGGVEVHIPVPVPPRPPLQRSPIRPAPLSPVPKPVTSAPTYAQKLADDEVAPGSPDDKPLRDGAMRMLKAAAQFYPKAVSREQMATLSGFSVGGGTYGTYFGELKRRGWIAESSDGVMITEAGMQSAGDVEPLPTDSQQLIDMWAGKFRDGAAKMLKFICSRYPEWVSDEEIGENTGFTHTGGTYGTYKGELVRNKLIEKKDGMCRASPTIFLES